MNLAQCRYSLSVWMISAVLAPPAYATSPFKIGVPATQTCAVLWDKDNGAFSREALAETGKIILRIPETPKAHKELPDLAGKAIELDLDSLHNLPNGMTSKDTIILGESAETGQATFAPYALYEEIVGCLPCPKLTIS